MSKVPEGATHYRRCRQDCCSAYFKVNFLLNDFPIYYWNVRYDKWTPYTTSKNDRPMMPIKKSFIDKLMEAF